MFSFFQMDSKGPEDGAMKRWSIFNQWGTGDGGASLMEWKCHLRPIRTHCFQIRFTRAYATWNINLGLALSIYDKRVKILWIVPAWYPCEVGLRHSQFGRSAQYLMGRASILGITHCVQIGLSSPLLSPHLSSPVLSCPVLSSWPPLPPRDGGSGEKWDKMR